MSIVPVRKSAQKSARSKKSADSQWPQSWNVLGHGLATGRYIDPDFARLEHEKLWSRVWQVAARLDEIPEAGDYTVYDIGDQSILLVRIDRDTVKAYYNVCPHRGTALGVGSGTFANAKIICPFHGWRWNLEGENEFVLERHEFRNGKLQAKDVALKEVHVALFAGFVFISMADEPQPFDEFIAPVRPFLEDLAIGEMHHYWWKSIPVPANWKATQEAFFETYHVPATHPQLDVIGAEIVRGLREQGAFMHEAVVYDAFPNGHGRFYAGYSAAPRSSDAPGQPMSEMLSMMRLLAEGMDAQVLQDNVEALEALKDKPIPEGSSLGEEYVKALYATAAAEQRPMPKPTPETIAMWGGEVFIFPNVMVLPHAGNAMIYRSRPVGSDPDRCIFEIMSTKTYPAAVKPPRAQVEHVTQLDDPAQVRLIPRQDLGNIPRIQRGLHSRGIRHIWLASHHEKIILNMHQELDRYLRS